MISVLVNKVVNMADDNVEVSCIVGAVSNEVKIEVSASVFCSEVAVINGCGGSGTVAGEDIGVESRSLGESESKLSIPLSPSNEG